MFCGTINRFGSVDICASKVGEDSSLQKLIRMVREAEDKKAPMARIADKAASWLVPVALGIAIIAGLATQDIVRAVTVLVVFCPCALVLATPTAISVLLEQLELKQSGLSYHMKILCESGIVASNACSSRPLPKGMMSLTSRRP